MTQVSTVRIPRAAIPGATAALGVYPQGLHGLSFNAMSKRIPISRAQRPFTDDFEEEDEDVSYLNATRRARGSTFQSQTQTQAQPKTSTVTREERHGDKGIDNMSCKQGYSSNVFEDIDNFGTEDDSYNAQTAPRPTGMNSCDVSTVYELIRLLQ